MAKTAKAEPHTTINYGSFVFEFGDDGTRQVSDAEVEALADYERNGGPAKVEISEDKPKKGGDGR